MNYFDGCANLAEAKARRNELVRKFHPDNLTRITQDVNAAYAQVQRDARPDGTLPASYQGKPAPAAAQVEPRIVYRERVVIKEASTPKRKPTRDELYCVKCCCIMKKASFSWVAIGNIVYCRSCYKGR